MSTGVTRSAVRSAAGSAVEQPASSSIRAATGTGVRMGTSGPGRGRSPRRPHRWDHLRQNRTPLQTTVAGPAPLLVRYAPNLS
jgi:hypothetical protein